MSEVLQWKSFIPDIDSLHVLFSFLSCILLLYVIKTQYSVAVFSLVIYFLEQLKIFLNNFTFPFIFTIFNILHFLCSSPFLSSIVFLWPKELPLIYFVTDLLLILPCYFYLKNLFVFQFWKILLMGIEHWVNRFVFLSAV